MNNASSMPSHGRLDHTILEQLEQFGDALFIHSFDGRIVEVNGRASRSLGYAREELLKMTVMDIEPDFNLHAAQNVWSSTVLGAEITVDGHQCTKQGNVIPVEIRIAPVMHHGQRQYVRIVHDVSRWVEIENQLKERNELNRIIMDNLPAGLAVNSAFPRVEFVYMNDKFPQYYGVTREELKDPDSFWDVVYRDPEFRKTMKAQVLDAIASGDPERMKWTEVPLVTEDGEIRYINAYGTPLPGRNLLLSWVLDVTEQKRAQLELMEAQSLLNQTQHLAKMGGWSYDLEEKRIRWTEEVYRIHGVSPEYDPNEMDSNFEFYLPTDREMLREAFDQAVSLGQPYDLQLRLQRRDGKLIWVRTIGKPMKKNGKILEIQGFIMDISEMKRMTDELTAQTEKLKVLHDIDLVILENIESDELLVTTVLHNLKDLLQPKLIAIATRITDSTGFSVHFTKGKSEDFGNTVVQLKKSIIDAIEKSGLRNTFIPDGFREVSLEIVRQIMPAETQDSVVTIPLIASDALRGLFILRMDHDEPVDGMDMELLQEVFSLLSIALEKIFLNTQIKSYFAELEQKVESRTSMLKAANDELEAFSYSVSHDLRAPLRAISGYTRMLVEDYGNNLDSEGKRICEVISQNAKNMGALIDDLLSFSRIGRNALQPTMVDMRNLAYSVYHELTSTDMRENMILELGELPAATADPTLIKQVWMNLIGNAIKFSSKNPNAKLQVGYGETDDEVIYHIKDNGVGFDMRYVDKLFGVFQRLHSIKEFEGTGVGLAIVQRIIHRHGGRVWAQGAVGEGATFFFSLRKDGIYGYDEGG